MIDLGLRSQVETMRNDKRCICFLYKTGSGFEKSIAPPSVNQSLFIIRHLID